MRRTAGTLAVLYVIAVAINYPWELLQRPLFTPASNPGNPWIHCFIASLADGLMVLLLFGLGRLVLGRSGWFVRPGAEGYALLLASGAVLGVLVEWVAVHGLQRWTYSDAMPRLPVLDIGAVPVLQMMLLPPLVFRVAAALRRS